MSKKMKKVILVFAMIMIVGAPTTAKASKVEISNNNHEISPRVDWLEWRFKKIDGKLYMRLYNYKTGEYVGDWILVE